MEETAIDKARIEIAYGAIVADGFFCLAFIVHILGKTEGLELTDFLGMGVILSVLLSACWVIYDHYWSAVGKDREVVKRLHIRELRQGAAIEYDGKWYRVERIDRASGEILIERIGRRGRILVRIEGREGEASYGQ